MTSEELAKTELYKAAKEALFELRSQQTWYPYESPGNYIERTVGITNRLQKALSDIGIESFAWLWPCKCENGIHNPEVCAK